MSKVADSSEKVCGTKLIPKKNGGIGKLIKPGLKIKSQTKLFYEALCSSITSSSPTKK
jgi:hypothetical protein